MAGIVFLTLSILIFNAVAILIPKRMSKIEIYATSLFAVVLEFTFNIVFDLKYNLYGYFNKGLDLQGFLVVFGIIPASNIIILNLYPFNKRIINRIIYVIIVSAACLLFEWLSLKSGYFYYTGWKLWYSAICYPILIVLMVLNFTMIRKWNKVN